MAATRTREPVKPLNLSSAQVARGAQAEKSRKAASKSALRKSLQKPGPVTVTRPNDPPVLPPAVIDQVAADAKAAADYAAYVAALRIDAAALGVDPDVYIAEQLAPPIKATAKTPYMGPMIALKTARATYSKGQNGILNNGDNLARLCSRYKPEDTVRALVIALELPANPYTDLNPGQQSMNLRNKARHAVSTGILSLAKIEAAYDQIKAVAVA